MSRYCRDWKPEELGPAAGVHEIAVDRVGLRAIGEGERRVAMDPILVMDDEVGGDGKADHEQGDEQDGRQAAPSRARDHHSTLRIARNAS